MRRARTFVTPVNILLTCEMAVWMDAACLPEVNHRSTETVLPPSVTFRSMGKWDRSRKSLPRGPLTLTLRLTTVTVTPSGTARVSDLRIVFCHRQVQAGGQGGWRLTCVAAEEAAPDEPASAFGV